MLFRSALDVLFVRGVGEVGAGDQGAGAIDDQRVVGLPGFRDLHPLQEDDGAQGAGRARDVVSVRPRRGLVQRCWRALADAFQRDPPFFQFYRTMQAYREAFSEGDAATASSALPPGKWWYSTPLGASTSNRSPLVDNLMPC